MLRMLRSRGMSAKFISTLYLLLLWYRVCCMLCLLVECLSLMANAAKSMLFLMRVHKCGFCKEIVIFNDLLTNSAETLFSKVRASNHCLHTLLPEKKILNYTLRNSDSSYTYYLNADLMCTNVHSLIGVCLTCDITMLCVVLLFCLHTRLLYEF